MRPSKNISPFASEPLFVQDIRGKEPEAGPLDRWDDVRVPRRGGQELRHEGTPEMIFLFEIMKIDKI